MPDNDLFVAHRLSKDPTRVTDVTRLHIGMRFLRFFQLPAETTRFFDGVDSRPVDGIDGLEGDTGRFGAVEVQQGNEAQVQGAEKDEDPVTNLVDRNWGNCSV